MTAANKDFFEALSMLEHERGITAEYLIEKIKAAIIIAVKKNYEVEEDHIRVDIDPDTGRFDVALIQDIVADEDWYDEHAEIGVTEARKIRSSYEVGDRIITRSRPAILAVLPPRPQSTSSVRASAKPSATSSSARSSPAHMTSCRPSLPAWIPRRAS